MSVQVGLSSDNNWWCHESWEVSPRNDLISFHHLFKVPLTSVKSLHI